MSSNNTTTDALLIIIIACLILGSCSSSIYTVKHRVDGPMEIKFPETIEVRLRDANSNTYTTTGDDRREVMCLKDKQGKLKPYVIDTKHMSAHDITYGLDRDTLFCNK